MLLLSEMFIVHYLIEPSLPTQLYRLFQAELLPISCTGGKFDLIKIPLVTLIDTLDTLVILGTKQA